MQELNDAPRLGQEVFISELQKTGTIERIWDIPEYRQKCGSPLYEIKVNGGGILMRSESDLIQRKAQ